MSNKPLGKELWMSKTERLFKPLVNVGTDSARLVLDGFTDHSNIKIRYGEDLSYPDLFVYCPSCGQELQNKKGGTDV